jgi:hypothetical protein
MPQPLSFVLVPAAMVSPAASDHPGLKAEAEYRGDLPGFLGPVIPREHPPVIFPLELDQS